MVEMMEDGYGMVAKGHIVEVKKVNWSNKHDSWCIDVVPVGHVDSVGYLAHRYRLYKRGDTAMRAVYLIFRVVKGSDGVLVPDLGYRPITHYGTENSVKEAVHELIRLDPDQKYAYGLINKLAQLDSPPVKITNLG
jgi:hypothetical protein